jgi:hypothetical protein
VNFLAHGFRHASDPWFCAGTALPDWARAAGRRLRANADLARPYAADAADPRRSALARGVLRHHEDDLRFHSGAAFGETSAAVAALLRPVASVEPAFRPRFASHLLVEALLDAEIQRRDPLAATHYYAALASLPPDDVAGVAVPLLTRPAPRLAEFVAAFVRARFVADYLDDGALAGRLDQVFRRVRQPSVAPALVRHVPAAREVVRGAASALLAAGDA